VSYTDRKRVAAALRPVYTAPTVEAAETALLEAMDGPAIVIASHPYAVLSTLIGHVAGFIFEHGSALCHLGILLREARVPAAVAAVPPVGRVLVVDGEIQQA
jgi:phosphoenolpyruvate-protein kinase (PTS system EI component)